MAVLGLRLRPLFFVLRFSDSPRGHPVRIEGTWFLDPALFFVLRFSALQSLVLCSLFFCSLFSCSLFFVLCSAVLRFCGSDASTRYLRTSEIARDLGVHVNTVRMYESSGLLPDIPRSPNGYRQYSAMHLEQARLVHLTLRLALPGRQSPAARPDQECHRRRPRHGHGAGPTSILPYCAWSAPSPRSAIEFLERWAAGHLMDTPRQRVHITKGAQHLNVTVDMLRNWERNSLIGRAARPSRVYLSPFS